MVEKLRPDELEAFKEAFDMFDKNMDGTISTKELHAAMRRGGQNPTESEVQDMINTVNIDLREAILHKKRDSFMKSFHKMVTLTQTTPDPPLAHRCTIFLCHLEMRI